MTARVAYAWEQDGKWCLSALPKTIATRPYNKYDTQQALIEEAGARGLQVEYE